MVKNNLFTEFGIFHWFQTLFKIWDMKISSKTCHLYGNLNVMGELNQDAVC